MSNANGGAPKRRVISAAYEGDNPPGVLSVGLVSLVELCQHAMPSPRRIREKMAEANLERVDDANAERFGRALFLENKVVAGGVRNLRHELYGKERGGALVLLLVSEGDGPDGAMVFCSTLFTGATEADVVKAVAKVTEREPGVGNTVDGPHGVIRRVFWDIPGTSGVRFMLASGPGDMDAVDQLRAVTAFNKADAS
ncbi:MAG: hypothetical protein AB7P07_11115 [Hyphomonadaceae bacterium]